MKCMKRGTLVVASGLLVVSIAAVSSMAVAGPGPEAGIGVFFHHGKMNRYVQRHPAEGQNKYRCASGFRSGAWDYTSKQHWTWQHPLPQGNTLFAVHLLDATHGWAVGEIGTILKLSGAEWKIDTLLNIPTLTSVFFFDTSNGWTVGLEGAMARYDGSKWSVVASHTKKDLYSVCFTDATHGWAVGHTILLKYNDASWSEEQVPAGVSGLTSITFTGPNRGWACGYNDDDMGVILKYNGSSWETIATGIKTNFWTISFADSLHGWIGTESGHLLNYDGISWKVSDSITAQSSIECIDFVDAGHGWAACRYNGTLSYCGDSWKTDLLSLCKLQGISFVDKNNGWAVGYDGGLYRYKDSLWSAYCKQNVAFFSAIAMTGADNGWAVGEKGLIYHYDGTKWARFESPTEKILRNIAALGPNDIWAIGDDGTIVRYKGSTWEIVPSLYGNDQQLTGMDFIHANLGWIVGSKTVLKWDGFSLRSTPCPLDSAAELVAVGFADATHGWAVGSRGAFVKYDGVSWTRDSLPGAGNGGDLLDIDFADKSHGCIVGYPYRLFFYDGTKWMQLQPPDDLCDQTFLTDVQYVNDTCVWFLDNHGNVARYNGEKWAFAPALGSGEGMSFTDPDHGWVCGHGLSILKGEFTDLDYTTGVNKVGSAVQPRVAGTRCLSYGNRLDLRGLPIDGAFHYEIYTMRGSIVEKKASSSRIIGIQSLPPGAYVLRVKNKDMRRAFRFVK